MARIAKFTVPQEILSDFLSEVSDRNLSATTGKVSRNSEHSISVEYEKDEEDDIQELEEWLEEQIEGLDEDEDDDDE